MMNGPFFRNYSKQQPRSSPKIISVPVHFVSSDQPPTTMSMLKDSAALKIQKVFRGFVVRKSVKKIASIGNEVSEIERRINDIEAVNLIRKDAKERLRVNETLMSLLFKLDSIRGVDCGIRDLRKAVTRKAIALQEKVDSIAQIGPQTLDSDSRGDEIDPDDACTTASEQVIETSNSDEAIEDGSVVKEAVENCNSADVIGEVEAMDASPAASLGGKEYDKTEENRGILEDLRDDNEKIKRLVSQISERNEMQTRMINSLSRRVEQLEKAEKLRRKKKKTHAVSRRRMDKDSFCV